MTKKQSFIGTIVEAGRRDGGEAQVLIHTEESELRQLELEELKREVREAALPALRNAEAAFLRYEQLHLAKGTPEGREKAFQNGQKAKQMADAIEALLSKCQEGTR